MLDTLDMRRELSSVREAGAAHAAEVFDAMETRAEGSNLASLLTDLDASRTHLPRWTAVLTALSERLPTDAHLTALRGNGDSLHVELQGADAASASDALREIPWLTGFRAVAPVQRDVGEGTEITERISAAATVSWRVLNARPAEPR